MYRLFVKSLAIYNKLSLPNNKTMAKLGVKFYQVLGKLILIKNLPNTFKKLAKVVKFWQISSLVVAQLTEHSFRFQRGPDSNPVIGNCITYF